MHTKEDEELSNIGFGKALFLTFFIIAIGMFEKTACETKDFIKKHLPR